MTEEERKKKQMRFHIVHLFNLVKTINDKLTKESMNYHLTELQKLKD